MCEECEFAVTEKKHFVVNGICRHIKCFEVMAGRLSDFEKNCVDMTDEEREKALERFHELGLVAAKIDRCCRRDMREDWIPTFEIVGCDEVLRSQQPSV